MSDHPCLGDCVTCPIVEWCELDYPPSLSLFIGDRMKGICLTSIEIFPFDIPFAVSAFHTGEYLELL